MPDLRAWHDAVLERDRYACQAAARFPGWAGPCWGRLEANHVLPRSRCDKAQLVDPDNGVTLCSGHHGYVTAHPVEAKAKGFTR